MTNYLAHYLYNINETVPFSIDVNCNQLRKSECAVRTSMGFHKAQASLVAYSYRCRADVAALQRNPLSINDPNVPQLSIAACVSDDCASTSQNGSFHIGVFESSPKPPQSIQTRSAARMCTSGQ